MASHLKSIQPGGKFWKVYLGGSVNFSMHTPSRGCFLNFPHRVCGIQMELPDMKSKSLLFKYRTSLLSQIMSFI